MALGEPRAYSRHPHFRPHSVFEVPGKVATDHESARLGELVGGSRRLACGHRDFSGNGSVLWLRPVLVPPLNRTVSEYEFVVDRITVVNDEGDRRARGEVEGLRVEARMVDVHMDRPVVGPWSRNPSSGDRRSQYQCGSNKQLHERVDPSLLVAAMKAAAKKAAA